MRKAPTEPKTSKQKAWPHRSPACGPANWLPPSECNSRATPSSPTPTPKNHGRKSTTWWPASGAPRYCRATLANTSCTCRHSELRNRAGALEVRRRFHSDMDLQLLSVHVRRRILLQQRESQSDRKSTRLNSSHLGIS